VRFPSCAPQVSLLGRPKLGSTRLRELTALDVEDWAHDLARDGLSASTIKGTLRRSRGAPVGRDEGQGDRS